MKNILLTGLLAIMGSATFFAQSCKTTGSAAHKSGIYISEKVLKEADWAGFKYHETLDKALQLDVKSMQAFLKFFGTLEEANRGEHAITCIELAQKVGDRAFGFAIWDAHNPRLTELLKYELPMAMGKTQVAELRSKPLQEVFPYTAKALAGEAVQMEQPSDAERQQKYPPAAAPTLSRENPNEGTGVNLAPAAAPAPDTAPKQKKQ